MRSNSWYSEGAQAPYTYAQNVPAHGVYSTMSKVLLTLKSFTKLSEDVVCERRSAVNDD